MRRVTPQSYLVVGAGLYGAVCARELTDAGKKVLIIEKRKHIGGNCYTRFHPEFGCHKHVYGPHIFHTSSSKVWKYINRFTGFNNYVHRVKVCHNDQFFSFPINLFTLYQLFGIKTPREAEAFFTAVGADSENAASLEEWCLNQIGQELYERFIRGYTRKQWQKDPRELPSDIIRRIPIRTTFNDNYFDDPHQGIPLNGYTAMFERLLSGVPVELEANFLSDSDMWIRKFDRVIYTGSIDAFFDYCFGILEYRSLRFENRVLDVHDEQGIAIINYTASDVPYTRKVEHKHFDMNLQQPKTIVTTEYPQNWQAGELEFYPVNTSTNNQIYHRYVELGIDEKLPVTFGGRLGNYQYYNMDQAIEAALEKVAHLLRLE
jgi:UDP-galactopyranose mutase